MHEGLFRHIHIGVVVVVIIQVDALYHASCSCFSGSCEIDNDALGEIEASVGCMNCSMLGQRKGSIGSVDSGGMRWQRRVDDGSSDVCSIKGQVRKSICGVVCGQSTAAIVIVSSMRLAVREIYDPATFAGEAVNGIDVTTQVLSTGDIAAGHWMGGGIKKINDDE